jgi:hypothetical protein
MINRQVWCALALLALSGSAAAQTVYKCRQSNGQVAFQQAPCDGAGTGAMQVQPANVVEGEPAGDAGVRAQAARNLAAQRAVARGQVVDGMTDSEVRQVLGQPETVNTDVINGVVRRQYVYRNGNDTRYVYTRDGVVNGVQYRPGTTVASSRPCYSQQDVSNAFTSASSITLTEPERQRLHQRARDMQAARC